MKTNIIIFAVTALFASASANAAGYWHAYDHIQQVNSKEELNLNNCEYAGEVAAHSSYGRSTKTVWKNKAKHKAIKQAGDLNATHVVWADGSTGYGNGRFVAGEAYICNENIVKAKAPE